MTDTPSPERSTNPLKRAVRSFVRREGRITPGQKRALSELLPRFGIDHATDPIDSIAMFERDAPLTLEIGFGDGSSILDMATANPDQNFIGVEVYRPGVGKLLLGVEENELTNVRVSMLDAHEIVQQRIQDGQLDRILIFFPDPWPKKKHLKRRLVQPAFVDTLSARLKPGGLLHVATDIESYAEHALEIIEGCSTLTNTAGTSRYVERPDWRPLTKYERRGTRLGHSVWDMVFKKAS